MADSKFCAACLREDEEEKNVVSWFVDCSEPVCGTCSRFHKKLSPPYKVVKISEINGVTSDLLNLSTYCEKHPKEKLALFCCQHDSVVCTMCVLKLIKYAIKSCH